LPPVAFFLTAKVALGVFLTQLFEVWLCGRDDPKGSAAWLHGALAERGA
jgi:hypothetical protein